MPKRKRGQVGPAPSRKSARLEERSRHAVVPISPQKQAGVRGRKRSRVLLSPSPSPSRSLQNDVRTARTTNPPAARLNGGRVEALPPKQEKPHTQAVKSAAGLPKEFLISEAGDRHGIDPINHWAEHSTWPHNYPKMASSGNSGKRARTSSSHQSGRDNKSRSYSQSRKDGDVPEPYTSAYEKHILTKGLDMDILKGSELVSEQSKETCRDFSKVTLNDIKPSIFPRNQLRTVLNDLKARNEAIINRDVTAMIIPPIKSLHFDGHGHLEHVVDEVNADWYAQCVLEGPRMRPDLAIGLFESAFTEEELAKLKVYKSVDNWAQFTGDMYFPFLMCEVKGGESLNVADLQNMHSGSVAVRAILRLEQEADKYRTVPRLQLLSGKIVVFSISHDAQVARLHGHFAVVQDEKWTYHRHRIDAFEILGGEKDLLILHNFVKKMFKAYVPEHIQRLKDAISALPESLFAATGISLDDGSEHSQQRDAQGFAIPAIPNTSRGRAAEDANMSTQLAKLTEQMSKREERYDEERKRSDEERKMFMEQLKEQKKQNEEQRKQMDELQSEIVSLLRKSKS